MATLLGRWLAVVALVLCSAGGCAIAPVHNQVLASASSSVSVQAFTVVKSSPVRVQCRPYFAGGAWTTLATFTSGTSPIKATQGDLYVASGSVVVPTACWYHWHSQYTTELRFMGGPYTSEGTQQPLAVYDEAGVDCVVDDFVAGVDYVEMMDHCRLKTSSGAAAQSIYVHAPD